MKAAPHVGHTKNEELVNHPALTDKARSPSPDQPIDQNKKSLEGGPSFLPDLTDGVFAGTIT